MNENERTRILNMVKEGKLTIDEAEKLLDALSARSEPEKEEREPVVLKDSRGRKSKKLRIVVDTKDETDGSKVNIAIPLSLVHALGPVALKSIPKDAKAKLEENNIDIEAILSEVDHLDSDEDLVNIDTGDGDDITKVRIYVE